MGLGWLVWGGFGGVIGSGMLECLFTVGLGLVSGGCTLV